MADLPPLIHCFKCPICEVHYENDEEQAETCRKQGYPEQRYKVGDHFVGPPRPRSTTGHHFRIYKITYFPRSHQARYHLQSWSSDTNEVPVSTGTVIKNDSNLSQVLKRDMYRKIEELSSGNDTENALPEG